MAKIMLPIDPSYCEKWGFWEGIRELVQNAKDGEEYDDYKMSVEHFPRSDRLVISNAGAHIDPSKLLLLGCSSKGGGGQRGKFGEGFVLGCLALVRAQFSVTIYNGDEVWRPEISKPEEGQPFAGNHLLHFITRKLPTQRDAFTVEITKVDKEVWAATEKLFLFLRPPDAKTSVAVGSDTVLLDKSHQGMVFCRGIYVNKVPELECGYDLSSMELDRDRHLINEWDLKYKLADLWTRAYQRAPEKTIERVYDMAKEDKTEVKNLSVYADQKLIQAMHKRFEEEHGEGTVAVSTTSESRDLNALGAKKTVVVNKTLVEMLAKTNAGAETATARLRSAIRHVFSWEELEPIEQDVCTSTAERITKEYVVVDFNDPGLVCRLLEDGRIGIARHHLNLRRELVRTLVVQEAKRRSVDTERVWLDALGVVDLPPVQGAVASLA